MTKKDDSIILSFMTRFTEFMIREDYNIASLQYEQREWRISLRKNGSLSRTLHARGLGILSAFNNAMRKANGQEAQEDIE